jgi:ribonuclease P protein component
VVVNAVSLPASRRMRSPAEFKRAYASGRRFADEFFTATAQANDLTWARLGMSIAARILRRAVDRNRVRRLIRESFRMHQQQLPSLDIIIGARAGALKADRAHLRASLDKLWRKIATSCAT